MASRASRRWCQGMVPKSSPGSCGLSDAAREALDLILKIVGMSISFRRQEVVTMNSGSGEEDGRRDKRED